MTPRQHPGRQPIDPMDPESALLAKEEPTPLQPRIRSRAHREKMRWAVEQLPQQEREVMELLLQGKSQPEIAIVLGLGRTTVWMRVKRAEERIRWFVTYGAEFTAEELSVAAKYLSEKQGAVLVCLWRTSSLAVTAAELGISVSAAVVRYRKAMSTLGKRARKYAGLRKFIPPLATMTRGQPGHLVRVLKQGPPLTNANRFFGTVNGVTVPGVADWCEPGARSQAFVEATTEVCREGAPDAVLPDDS